MLTYVINTSSNKTLDSNRLFELSGYNRIRWMSCDLDRIKECADEIFQSNQNVFVESFRIAVLVDFFSFDKIRTPYSNDEYKALHGVDLALYLPFIEAYLTDHVFGYLEKRNLFAADCSIIYIHGGQYDDFLQISNGKYQLSGILTGDPKTRGDISKEMLEERLKKDNALREQFGESQNDTIMSVEEQLAKGVPHPDLRYPLETYSTFNLYCSQYISLPFSLGDYPYGYTDSIDFDAFYRAFMMRFDGPSHIHTHHFIAEHTGTPTGVAFDMLVLSLFLVSLYERESTDVDITKFSASSISPQILQEVLERSLLKIRSARQAAKSNNNTYYLLNQFLNLELPDRPHASSVEEELDKVKAEHLGKDMPFEEQFEEVLRYCSHEKGSFTGKDQEEFNQVMSDYLKKRDALCEKDFRDEFLKYSDNFQTTDQFPSKEEYEYLLEKQKNKISEIFKRALNAEYLNVDYSVEEARAQDIKERYLAAKACLKRSIIGDIAFLVLTVLSMLLPYGMLQVHSVDFAAVILYLFTGAIFAGLFVLSVFLQTLPFVRQLRKTISEMKEVYQTCIAKHRYAFSDIKHRYQHDLAEIEQARYEIRQLKYFYDENVKKDLNIKNHRELLEEVEDRISGILNNLGITVAEQELESVEGEFNVNKPVRSVENKVYRVFSLDVIEAMFPNGRKED